MPQSLSFILVHLVFSTKDRRSLLKSEVRPELLAYIATVCRGLECECFRVGGSEDHLHLAVRLHPTKNLANVVKELKTSTSQWMKTKGVAEFSWQRGYAAFSVSPADIGALIRYIETQDAHHQKRNFQAEMRAMFEKYHVAFDERYVWD